MSDPTADGFEATLRDHPDDRTVWSAYADYLAECGVPRGEFMRVQLALEDESLGRHERDAIKTRERELLRAHRREWIGSRLFQDWYHPSGRAREYSGGVTFRRGWVWEIEFLRLDDWSESDLARTFEARWAQRLTLAFQEAGVAHLAAAPFASVLRVLECQGASEGLPSLLPNLPRLERLVIESDDESVEGVFAAPMPKLRTLSVSGLSHFPTNVLASNPTLTNLATITFQPGHRHVNPHDGASLTVVNLDHIARSPFLTALTRLRMTNCSVGDDAIAILVTSGLLNRLEILDLSDGALTDAGAVALARALRRVPHKLKTLRLENNALTGTGLAALRATGVTVEAPRQHRSGDSYFLTSGDYE